MVGRIIDAKAHLIADRDKLFAYIKRDSKEVTLEVLADGVCKAFCGPRGLAQGLSPMQADIHRRQHIEIATAIFEQIPD